MDLPDDLAALVANALDTDDRGPFLVAADYLLEHQQPLGEFMTLALGVSAASLSKTGIARAAELQRRLDPFATSRSAMPYVLDWRWGLVDRIVVVVNGMAAPLHRALRAPAARFARSLTIRVTPEAPEPVMTFVKAVAASPLVALRELHIIEDDPSDEVTVDELLARLPHLRVFHVDGVIRRLAHPTLRRLHLRMDARELPAGNFELATPALEHLRWLTTIDAVPPPRLRRELPALSFFARRASTDDDSAWTMPGDLFTMPDLRAIEARSDVGPTNRGFLVATGGARSEAGTRHAIVDRHEIGRAPNSWLVLPDDGARRHARIEYTANRRIVLTTIDDADTRLFGVPVAGELPLRHGDELSFGLATYRVQLDDGVGSSTSSSPVQ